MFPPITETMLAPAQASVVPDTCAGASLSAASGSACARPQIAIQPSTCCEPSERVARLSQTTPNPQQRAAPLAASTGFN